MWDKITYPCLLVLILIRWQPGSDIESKGDQLSSPAEWRIWARGLWNRISSRLNAHRQCNRWSLGMDTYFFQSLLSMWLLITCWGLSRFVFVKRGPGHRESRLNHIAEQCPFVSLRWTNLYDCLTVKRSSHSSYVMCNEHVSSQVFTLH